MDISNGRNVDNDEVNVNPQIGMEFDSEVAAYNFYNEYGRRVGFSIRRGTVGRNKQSKELTSRIFKCCKEGVRDTRRREQLPKNPRAETRCGCNACMGIKLNRDKGKFEIYLLTVEHNHELVPSRCSYMMGSQRRISELHATQIDLAEISGIPLRSAYELLGREAGGRESLGFIKLDQKNYLRSRRQKKLAFGEAGSIYEYFKKKSMENDAFYSDFQFDEEELITNIFWADARMIMDYGIFGDVVSFDTTYKINKEHRPFAVFVGLNHHRETVVFGAALMYDETVESYKWLFRTFLEAMSHKAPKTILTDQDAAMAIAIKEVFLSSFYRLCKWHIMQNALKHTNNFGTANHGIGTIKNKIAHLMDNINTEQEFLDAWDTMLEAHNVRAEPHVWHEIIEAKPEAAQWMRTRVKYYNKLYDIYAADRATGRHAECAREAVRNLETERLNLNESWEDLHMPGIDVLSGNEGNSLGFVDAYSPQFVNPNNCPSTSSSRGSKHKARRADYVESQFQSLSTSIKDLMDAIKESNEYYDKHLSISARQTELTAKQVEIA